MHSYNTRNQSSTSTLQPQSPVLGRSSSSSSSFLDSKLQNQLSLGGNIPSSNNQKSPIRNLGYQTSVPNYKYNTSGFQQSNNANSQQNMPSYTLLSSSSSSSFNNQPQLSTSPNPQHPFSQPPPGAGIGSCGTSGLTPQPNGLLNQPENRHRSSRHGKNKHASPSRGQQAPFCDRNNLRTQQAHIQWKRQVSW